MKRSLGALAALILAVLALNLLWPGSAPAASERSRVKVGYFILPGLQDMSYGSHGGRRSGYAYEYIRAVATLANWDLEFYDGSFQECLSLLQAGNLDIMGAIQYTQERGQGMLFPEIQSGISYSTLRVRRDSTLSYEDFNAFNDMKVGVTSGNSNVSAFADYRRLKRFTASVIYYDTDSDLTGALRSGAIDAMLVPSARFASREREVARFGPRPFYFVVNKARPELLTALNDAQDQLLTSDPMFQNRLMSKYLAMGRQESNFALTEEEKSYLATNPAVRVAYDANSRPVEFLDPATGSIAGISAAIFGRISERTGLQFEFVPCLTYGQALELMSEGRVDVLSDFILEYETAAALNLRATRPYLSLPMSQVVNRKAAAGVSVIPAGYLTDFWVSRLTSGTEIIRADNVSKAFAEVAAGRADITFLNTYVANELLQNGKNPDLEAIGVPGYSKDYALGLAPHAPMELLSLLNKPIASLSGQEVDALLVEALLDNRPTSLSELVRRNPLIALLPLSVIVAAAIVALLAVLWYRNKNLRRVRDQLYVDQLTGKWSIHRFRKEAEQLLKTSPDVPFAVIYLDINSIKYINDVYGYAAGDLTLKSVADYLVRNLRPGEMSARIMADHFALLLRDWSEQTQSRVQYILHDVRHIEQIQQFQISTSAGVYVRSSREMDISAMLDKANYARGVAKRGLADVAVLYDESIRESIRAEKEIENVMLGALRRGEFEPYFQPKVDMLTGRMVGAEALVRWIHPDKGLIPPQNFIPLFEKNGFIVDLDLYIYEQVCNLLQRWQARFKNLKPISCNFSRLHIRNSQFQNSLETIAALYNVPPHILELEITESVAMENIDTLVALMFNLQKNGFRITIDDFGAGYSSLGLLQKLPANTLKLDKNFVEDIIDHRDRVIVKGVVDIAQKLNMDVVCEGIETFEQAEFLQSVNCRIAQGYYYSRPMRAHDFELFMEATL